MTNLEGQESIKGPFITCACLCEKVLQEKDGILSAVRIIDRMTINLIPNPAFSLPPGILPPLPTKLPPLPLTVSLLIMFKSGDIRGSYPIRIVGNNPSQREFFSFENNALFEGEDRGVNLVLNINFVVQEEGVHWFNVNFSEEKNPRTRIPLRIVYQRMVSTPGAQ